ncbi:Orf30 [Lactococcus phage bIL286]|uniref:Orf30 n=1 Tax=Lactococcus phage bIL286 TaxID=151536 RepID=UPI000009B1C2|nr:Orf30 [Lactococcus phage bIL286]AAK08317.1 Orf30 [Lactococcus phage bIL286]
MMKQTTCYGCDKPIEPEWLPEGEFIVCDECSSDTDSLSVEKLQEQLNTAKKALTEIAYTRQEIWRGGTLVGFEATKDAKIAYDALAAIGWDGCSVGLIVKSGLTKEELEGSGDE